MLDDRLLGRLARPARQPPGTDVHPRGLGVRVRQGLVRQFHLLDRLTGEPYMAPVFLAFDCLDRPRPGTSGLPRATPRWHTVVVGHDDRSVPRQ